MTWNLLIPYLAALIYLLLSARSDLKYRSIHPLSAILTAAAAVPFNLLTGLYPPAELVYLLGGGAFLFLISFASHSALGAGDCFVITACGFLIGFSEEIACMTSGFLLCAIWSISLLLRKKAERKDTLPFLPFLFAGHLTVFTLNLIT